MTRIQTLAIGMGIGGVCVALVALGGAPAASRAAPLAQATATPTATATATPTITPTPTLLVRAGWTREDQPNGIICYIYESGFGRPVSCVSPPP